MLPTETKYSIRGIMKISKAQEKILTSVLKHITGECGCSANSKTCIYWKLVDKGGDNWQANEIIKVIKKL